MRLSEDGPTTFLISMDSTADQHDFILGLNVDDTRRIFAPMQGFVACMVFSDHRRERVFEIAQWERPEHFLAATTEPAFTEHSAVLDQRCRTTDARAYRVVHSARGALPDGT